MFFLNKCEKFLKYHCQTNTNSKDTRVSLFDFKMGYVDDLDINSYSELFYMPGQYNSFHTESNTINPYYLPPPDSERFRHPLSDSTGAWKRLVKKGAENFASNPDWEKQANIDNNILPNSLPFTSYSERPGNMPNVVMFGDFAAQNELVHGSPSAQDFVVKPASVGEVIRTHLKNHYHWGALLVVLAFVIFYLKK